MAASKKCSKCGWKMLAKQSNDHHMLHQSFLGRNDYERKINYGWPSYFIKISIVYIFSCKY